MSLSSYVKTRHEIIQFTGIDQELHFDEQSTYHTTSHSLIEEQRFARLIAVDGHSSTVLPAGRGKNKTDKIFKSANAVIKTKKLSKKKKKLKPSGNRYFFPLQSIERSILENV